MKSLPLLLLCVIFLAACDPTPAPFGSEVAKLSANAWIDAPLNDSVLPFAPVDVTSHFYHPSGVKQIELSVNGSALRTDPSPDTKSDFVFITQKWSPPAPGEYRLSVRAQSNGGDWGDSATAAVTVGEVVTVTPTIPARPTTITVTPPTRVITSTVVTRTNTPAIVTRPPTNTSTNTPQLPTRPPTNTPTRSVPTTVAPPVSTGPTFGSPSASRTLFYNIAGCGSTEVTINIAVNDSVSMTRVIISYRVGTGATQTQTMSNTTNNLWSKTLRGGQEVPTTPTGTLTYSITATNSQGKSATSPNYNLTYSNCKP